MQALILAGGLGTRLRGIVKNIPKVMVDIKGKPFLEYLVLQLKNYSINDIILCIGYLSEKIEEYFKNGYDWRINISYSKESNSLGTGGAIKLAENLITEDDFIVMNGDSFFDINLCKLIDYHLNKKALVTMALAKVKDIARYGVVERSKGNEIKNFIEKGECSDLNLINGGVYILNRKIFDFTLEGEKISLEKEIFPKIIGKEFYGISFDNYFIDIGIPEDYRKLQKNPQYLFSLLSHKRRE
jgi:D-glycero-alpha-D-manno-heptose 1-phosphate guanylyltransferase